MTVNSENLERLRLAISQRQVLGDFQPSVYVVEPTNRCNVNCIMCPNSRFKSHELGDIQESLFATLMEKISPYAELVMLYFLGESTLHPNFGGLLEIARTIIRGKIVVSTNMLELSGPTIEALVQNTDVVIACIDRWNKAAYEKIRVGSCFERVVASTEALLTARSAKSKPLVIIKALDIALPNELNPAFDNEAKEFDDYWRARDAIPLSGWLNTWAGQLSGLKRLARKANPYAHSSRSPCADLWFKMVINWRGEVAICCHDWSSSIVIGRLDEDGLHNIWHSPQLADLRRAHIGGRFTCNALCAGCIEWGEAEELDAYVNLSEDDFYRVF